MNLLYLSTYFALFVLWLLLDYGLSQQTYRRNIRPWSLNERSETSKNSSSVQSRVPTLGSVNAPIGVKNNKTATGTNVHAYPVVAVGVQELTSDNSIEHIPGSGPSSVFESFNAMYREIVGWRPPSEKATTGPGAGPQASTGTFFTTFINSRAARFSTIKTTTGTTSSSPKFLATTTENPKGTGTELPPVVQPSSSMSYQTNLANTTLIPPTKTPMNGLTSRKFYGRIPEIWGPSPKTVKSSSSPDEFIMHHRIDSVLNGPLETATTITPNSMPTEPTETTASTTWAPFTWRPFTGRRSNVPRTTVRPDVKVSVSFRVHSPTTSTPVATIMPVVNRSTTMTRAITTTAWNPFPNITTTSTPMATMVTSNTTTAWNPFPTIASSTAPTKSTGSTFLLTTSASPEKLNATTTPSLSSSSTSPKNKTTESKKKPKEKKPKRIVNFQVSILKSHVIPRLAKPAIRDQLVYLLFGPRLLSFSFVPSLLAPNIDAQLAGFHVKPKMLAASLVPQLLSPTLRHQLIGGTISPSFLSLALIPKLLSPEVNTQLMNTDLRYMSMLSVSMIPRLLSPKVELQLIRVQPRQRLLSTYLDPRVLSPSVRLSLLRVAPTKSKNSKLFIGGPLSPDIDASLNDGFIFRERPLDLGR